MAEIVARIRPRDARKQQIQERCLRRRAAGLSYRAIGRELGLSHTYARRMCEAAYTEAVECTLRNAAAMLGQELDRMDRLIRAASLMLASVDATAGEKIRAVAEIRRCSEAKVRWLGLDAPERIRVQGTTSEEVIRAEVAGLSQEELDRELEAFGYSPPEVGEQIAA